MINIGNPDNPKVLIVDDEIEVLISLADLLRKEFHIFATADVEEAMNLLASCNLISVVISDQRMPVMTGSEFLARVAKISPDTARILLTGYADIDAVIDAVNQGQIVQYITKPWDAVKLREILRPIAERHHLLQDNRRLLVQLAQLNASAQDSASRIETLETMRSSLINDNQVLQASYDHLDKSFWRLRKIQEVLPICMKCGKVKTTESSWEDVLTFLKNNSMFLSHGYCPECHKKLKNQLAFPDKR